MATAAWLGALGLVTTVVPLACAWRINRRTTLRSALSWATLAWLCWLLRMLGAIDDFGGRWLPYLALALTGCAGMAILGARRPGVGPWNFVVLGLLAALLLPLAEGWGEPRLETTRLLFLTVPVGIGVVNYLPTRLGFAAAALAVACAAETLSLVGWLDASWTAWLRLNIAAAPWLALASGAGKGATTVFDQDWRAFRDRFGLLWALRQREQFNRAAANAGHPVELGWSGLRPPFDPSTPQAAALLRLLHAALKRFGPADDETSLTD